MRTRPTAVAGMFYPDDQGALRSLVDAFLVQGAHLAEAPAAPKAVIVPHAGYVYSGAIAGTAYAALRPRSDTVERILLVGPSHRMRFRGLAASGMDGFASPVGDMLLDRSLCAEAAAEGLVHTMDDAHAEEHSLEVQLPFLRTLFPKARILPLLTGDEDFRAVERAFDFAWGGDETLIVVSSDLSHYLPYETARRQDGKTAGKIAELAAGAVASDDACGSTAVNGLLAAAARRGTRCDVLDLRNSGDTAGSRDRVVGYGAFAFRQ